MKTSIKESKKMTIQEKRNLPNPASDFLDKIPVDRTYPGPYFIYFLWQDDQIVYVGQTHNVNNRVISHREDKLFNKVSYVEFTGITKPDLNSIEKQYIDEIYPVYNSKDDCIYKCDQFAHVKGLSPENIFKVDTFYEENDNDRNIVFYDGSILHRYIWTQNHFMYKKDNIVVEEGVMSKAAKTRYRYNKELGRLFFDIMEPKSKSKFGSIYVFATRESHDLYSHTTI